MYSKISLTVYVCIYLCMCVCICYYSYVCMYICRWGFEKTYDFVFSKKPDLDLNKGFIQQMFALDMKMLAARQRKGPNLANGTPAKPVHIHTHTYIHTYTQKI